MRTILLLCLSILFLPLTLAAEGLTVAGGTLDTDYSYKDNVYTVLTGTKLTFSGTTTTDRIVIAEGVTADITLNDLSIDVSTIDGAAAIRLEKKAKLTLHITGTESTLKSGNNAAGIGLSDECDLHITAESETPNLTVFGGNNSSYKGSSGAAIGSNLSEEGKASIRISNGTISATGGTGGSWGNAGDGIGQSGDRKLQMAIVFDGGKITAKGGEAPYLGTAGYGINGDVIVNSGIFTNCTLKDNIVINDGTFTNCPISGTKVIINKGTINNLDTDLNNNISADNLIINGGTINISCHNKPCIEVSNSKYLEINGGNINVNTNLSHGGNPTGEAATIGPLQGSPCGTIIINEGLINAKLTGQLGGGGAAIGGAGKSWSGGSNKDSGKITIKGGTITAKGSSDGSDIGGGWSDAEGIVNILGGSVNVRKIKTLKNDVYLGITPEIENATDVSVDDIPYYISGNHPEGDNKLYLYMTGTDHTVTVRKNDNSVTTYTATYVPAGVDGDGNNKGYFSFDGSSTTAPSDNSTIAFEAKNITTTYNKESNALKVTLTVTEPEVNTRSAAMNSVQLALSEGTKTYFSDRQTVTGSGEYTFTFDTQGLGAGSYTLTANYGGSATSLAATEQTTRLTIEQAEGSTASDYEEPNTLTATYGQTLADVTLPAGWAWSNSETSVGNASSSPSNFAATFTPADTKNYKTVSKDLSVTVNKATASDPGTPAVLSPSPITYGAKLSDITITNGWEWVDETIVPTVSNSGYQVSFSITDYTNYDWSKINGYDSNTHRVIRTVSVTVSRADLKADNFTFAAPTDLVYDGQEKAATVTANDGLTGVGTITVKYYKEGATEPSDPVDAGTYTVKIDVAQGDNYNAVTDLTATDWMFTIIPKSYTVAIASPIANGTVSADKTQAIEGETVTLTVTPAAGYERETLSYTTDDSKTEAITETIFVMPAANVTVTATFKASSVPPVDPPVNPPVDPDPDDPAPVHYTVTLPAIEGATTDPAAGSYEVESWGSFSFLLTLDEGYRTDSHPVVTARGETLTPNASTGKYTIQHVRSDITVEITGIVKDVATGNKTLSDGFHITTSGGLLLVTVPRAIRLYLTDTSGRLILTRQLPTGDTRIDDLAAGVYLLTLEGEKTKKIIIR